MQAITLRHCLIKVVTYVEISKLRFFRGEKKRSRWSCICTDRERDLLSQWTEDPRCPFGTKELNLPQKCLFQTDLLQDWPLTAPHSL